MDWSGLTIFWHEVFYPYLIGGILPGIICATIAYYLSVPLLRAYQKRRKGVIKAKFEALKKKAAAKAEAKRKCRAGGSEGKRSWQCKISLRLGVNIDHVATVRNARGGAYPDPLRAARASPRRQAPTASPRICAKTAATSRMPISKGLMEVLTVPLNFEMAATDEMQAIALRHKPHAVCIVPEKREERTTEGGLEVAREENRLAHFIAPLREAGCRVSIFIAADQRQIEAANRIGARGDRTAHRGLLRRICRRQLGDRAKGTAKA